ncbi:MAG: peptidylprolyl isomerase [Clostridium sp.]
MKNTKKIIALTLSVLMICSLTACNAIEKTPEAIAKTVVAKVGKYKITKAEVDSRLGYVESVIKEKFGEDYEKNPEAKNILTQQRLQVADSMLFEKVILIKAKELKVIPEEKELNEEIEIRLKEIKDEYESEEKYQETLIAQSVTEEQLRENIRMSIISEKLQNEIFKDMEISEVDLTNHYEMYKYKYTEEPSGAELAHILVETQEEAQEIKKQLDEGADFAELAETKSIDEKTKAKGGTLGFKTYEEINANNFMYSAIALDEGQHTEALQSQEGWHVTKVIEKRDFPQKPFDEVKEEIKNQLLKEKKEALWKSSGEKWNSELKPVLYEEKLS